MKSTFVRKGTVKATDPGTRAGLHGQTLVSMGLTDLDRLLGGGLPLGTVLLVLEDTLSQQHLNIIRYFLAEGVACGQRAHWATPAAPAGGAGQFLPAEAASSVAAADQGREAGASTSIASSATEPELRIAWQYKKYIQEKQQQEALATSNSEAARGSARVIGQKGTTGKSSRAADAGAAREWCHTFDLTRHMGNEAVQKAGMVTAEYRGQDALQRALQDSSTFIRTLQGLTRPTPPLTPPAAPGPLLLAARGPEAIGRLVVQSLGAPAWDGAAAERPEALLRAVFGLRQLAAEARCAVLVTCHAGAFATPFLEQLQHVCGAVIALGSVADDSPVYRLLPDASSACALLSVRKLPAAGMAGPRTVDGLLHVIRHKRRRLAITAVEIDPDAETRQQQQQKAAGGMHGGSAVSVTCGGPAGAPKPLDF